MTKKAKKIFKIYSNTNRKLRLSWPIANPWNIETQ